MGLLVSSGSKRSPKEPTICGLLPRRGRDQPQNTKIFTRLLYHQAQPILPGCQGRASPRASPCRPSYRPPSVRAVHPYAARKLLRGRQSRTYRTQLRLSCWLQSIENTLRTLYDGSIPAGVPCSGHPWIFPQKPIRLADPTATASVGSPSARNFPARAPGRWPRAAPGRPWPSPAPLPAKDVPCGASPQSSQRSRLLRVIGGGTSSLPARLRRDGGVKPLQTTPTYGYGIWDSHGRGRSTSPPPCGHLSFVICHIIFRT